MELQILEHPPQVSTSIKNSITFNPLQSYFSTGHSTRNFLPIIHLGFPFVIFRPTLHLHRVPTLEPSCDLNTYKTTGFVFRFPFLLPVF